MAQKRVQVLLTCGPRPERRVKATRVILRLAGRRTRRRRAQPVQTVVTPAMRRYLERPLHDLGLGVKTVSALENDSCEPDSQGRIWHIRTIGQLLAATPAQLLSVTNLGACTLRDIYTRLSAIGFVKPGYERLGKKLAAAENRRVAAANQLRKRLGYLVDLAQP